MAAPNAQDPDDQLGPVDFHRSAWQGANGDPRYLLCDVAACGRDAMAG